MIMKELHDIPVGSGKLGRMPVPLQYAIIRGFQLHDLLHVLTGYEATGPSEIAWQAFCLAQLRFPYFAMWMSVTTARAALLDPDTVEPMMDTVTDGWSYGRRSKNLQFARCEEFNRSVVELQREYGLERTEPFRIAAWRLDRPGTPPQSAPSPRDDMRRAPLTDEQSTDARTRIRGAAVTLFEEGGLKAVTMRAVAARLEVAPSARSTSTSTIATTCWPGCGPTRWRY